MTTVPRTTGLRLVPDDGLPSWLAVLLALVDGLTVTAFIRRPQPAIPPGARRSAVLILLADGPNGLDLLLTARAETLRSHAGQPAFPGGACDAGEDAVATALREGREETGLDPADVLPVALLPDLYLPPSGFVISPVLGYSPNLGSVGSVDPAETAAVVRVPLTDLIDPANRVMVRHPRGFVGPAFEVAGMLVWGFTAALIDGLLTVAGWQQRWDRGRTVDIDAAGRRS